MSNDFSTSQILGERYRLIQRLGTGGMGSVWRAEDLKLDAEVAIKLIDPELAQAPEAIARFRREAQAAAAIRSTYVVQILDYGIDRGTPFIAMELLHGESLAKRLRREKCLSPEQAARILGHVGRALAVAHEHGIVHRDMKPDNVFLVREGDEDIGKLVDFGIARKPEGLDQAAELKTSTGALLGTPFYMSPEQATGQVADHQTDIWSFGAIAFECLTGERPFRGDTLGALFHAICMAEIPVPSRIAAVPRGFDAWFARATARDKSRRFATIKEAAELLREICEGGVSSSRLARLSREAVPSSRQANTAVPVSSRHSELTVPPASRTLMGMGTSPWTFPVFVLTLSASVAFASGLAVWIVLRGNSGAAPDDSIVATVNHETSSTPLAGKTTSGAAESTPGAVPLALATRGETASILPESRSGEGSVGISVVPVFTSGEDPQTDEVSARRASTPSNVPNLVGASQPMQVPSNAPIASQSTQGSNTLSTASQSPGAPSNVASGSARSDEPRTSAPREQLSAKISVSGFEAPARKSSSVPIGDNAAGI